VARKTPPSLSLVESKRTIKKQDDVLATFRATQKSKAKSINRARDQKLKERADKTKRKKEVIEVDRGSDDDEVFEGTGVPMAIRVGGEDGESDEAGEMDEDDEDEDDRRG
jgi:hypothetical protein